MSNNNGNNNSYIVRDHNTFLRPRTIINNGQAVNGNNHLAHFFNAGATATMVVRAPVNGTKRSHCRSRGGSSLPQIAIKRKDNDSLTSANTEVVLLNGNWDTSNEIPNIIAEMHNVNVEELQSLQQSTCSSSKQVKLESVNDCPAASPMGSDSGIEGDCSEGNLSWLLNYKIHELPPVPDCPTNDNNQVFSNSFPCQTNINHINNQNHQPYQTESPKQFYFQQQIQNVATPRPEKQNTISSNRIEECNKQHNNSYRYTGPKKPPFTYTELIEHALNEKGELTVSGIYQWISDHFPFYKQNDDRWKNSVRHNLSINPHFRKGSKAIHGAGHLWTIAQKEDKKTWNIKKQRMQQFIQTTLNDWNKERQQEIELAAATASILPDARDDINNHGHVMKMDIPHQVQSLGRKQNVEVEYVIDMSGGLGDFLCPPVSKEQVVEECGLGGDYLITDLNPNALGLNLTEAEIINGANLYDDLNFQCYELQTE